MSRSGGRSGGVPGIVAGPGTSQPAVWTLAVETLATASAVAAAATVEDDLGQGTASAICGAFADWVFVDLIRSGQPRRAVAAYPANPGLTGLIAGIPLWESPMISSAVQRQTPVIEAAVGNQWLLGSLPDGKPVAGAVGAQSAAVGPIITADGAACGAITIVRTAARPYVRFVELGFLCHIAELTGVAVKRLRRR
jgi:hypothetical protein